MPISTGLQCAMERMPTRRHPSPTSDSAMRGSTSGQRGRAPSAPTTWLMLAASAPWFRRHSGCVLYGVMPLVETVTSFERRRDPDVFDRLEEATFRGLDAIDNDMFVHLFAQCSAELGAVRRRTTLTSGGHRTPLRSPRGKRTVSGSMGIPGSEEQVPRDRLNIRTGSGGEAPSLGKAPSPLLPFVDSTSEQWGRWLQRLAPCCGGASASSCVMRSAALGATFAIL